jgi:hypothetical protein
VIGWRKKIIFFFANQTISVLTEGDDEKIKEDEE